MLHSSGALLIIGMLNTPHWISIFVCALSLSCYRLALMFARKRPNAVASKSAIASNSANWSEIGIHASFLLAVERTAAAGGRPKLGIQALYYESPANRTSLRYAALHPRFRWEIGTPVETKVAVPLYKLPGFNTYARRFTTGLVLMNPSWNNTDHRIII